MTAVDSCSTATVTSTSGSPMPTIRICRPAGTFAAAADFPRVEVGKWNYLAPRLAAAWDVAGDGRTVWKGTWGWFNPESSQAGTYDQNGSCTTTYRWSDPNRNNTYDAGEVGDFLSTTSASTNKINPS